MSKTKPFIDCKNAVLNSFVQLAETTALKCLKTWPEANPPFAAYQPNSGNEYSKMGGGQIVWLRDNLLTSEAMLGLVANDTLSQYLFCLAQMQLKAGTMFEYTAAFDFPKTPPLPASGMIAEMCDPCRGPAHLSGTLDPEPGFIEMAYLACVWGDDLSLLLRKTQQGRPLIDCLHEALDLFSWGLRYEPTIGLLWSGMGASWGDSPAHYDGTTEHNATTYGAYNNVYLYAAARKLSYLCRKVGHDDRAVLWHDRAVSLAEAIKKHLWHPDGYLMLRIRRSPVQATDPAARLADEGIDFEGNALAIIEGLLNSSDSEQVLNNIENIHSRLYNGWFPMFWPLFPADHVDSRWYNKPGSMQNGGIWPRTTYRVAQAAFSARRHDLGYKLLLQMTQEEIKRNTLSEWFLADGSPADITNYGWNCAAVTTILRGLFGIVHDLDSDCIRITPSSCLADGATCQLRFSCGRCPELSITYNIPTDCEVQNKCTHTFKHTSVTYCIDNDNCSIWESHRFKR